MPAWVSDSLASGTSLITVHAPKATLYRVCEDKLLLSLVNDELQLNHVPAAEKKVA